MIQVKKDKLEKLKKSSRCCRTTSVLKIVKESKARFLNIRILDFKRKLRVSLVHPCAVKKPLSNVCCEMPTMKKLKVVWFKLL
jgi:hypothetical protein